MAPGHIPSYLFGTLITCVGYGELTKMPCARLITSVTSGIAITLFVRSIGTILRKRRTTGKLNLPLVIPSILIFILATLVSFDTATKSDLFLKLSPSECYWFIYQYIYGFHSLREKP